jgi:hypothetical protein
VVVELAGTRIMDDMSTSLVVELPGLVDNALGVSEGDADGSADGEEFNVPKALGYAKPAALLAPDDRELVVVTAPKFVSKRLREMSDCLWYLQHRDL